MSLRYFAKLLLQTYMTTVSMGMSKLGKTMIFINPGMKINGADYCDVLLTHQLLPACANSLASSSIFKQDGALAHQACETSAFWNGRHLLSSYQTCAPLTWLTNRHPSVLWCCWLGRLTSNIVSEMTHDVSCGTLNVTIPHHTIRAPDLCPNSPELNTDDCRFWETCSSVSTRQKFLTSMN